MVSIVDFILNEFSNDILSVHIDDNKSVKSQTLELGQFSAHKRHSLKQLLVELF